MGIRYTSSRRGNVCARIGLLNTMRSHFRTSPLLYHARKASTISSSANTMPAVLESSDGGAQSYEIRRQAFALCTKLLVGVVSLSVLRGDFVLTKVRLGLISVVVSGVEGCPLIGGSKCIGSMVKSIGGQEICPLTEVVRFSEGPLLEVLLYMYTVKTNLPFYQIIWLLQLHDCLSYANLKNVVLVKHFVGG